ncbi:hypothetical protein AVEN_267716-1 [Araneus ventricosus]|uniref:Uncharacterized protein n=1 Tax=Araneus ventricosus TaxID=182803 RepID=A0A4Y2CYU0_ARAVE|nr:hypothetical protein AVEN_267716-1 [Araneus ventricosus]
MKNTSLFCSIKKACQEEEMSRFSFLDTHPNQTNWAHVRDPWPFSSFGEFTLRRSSLCPITHALLPKHSLNSQYTPPRVPMLLQNSSSRRISASPPPRPWCHIES